MTNITRKEAEKLLKNVPVPRQFSVAVTIGKILGFLYALMVLAIPVLIFLLLLIVTIRAAMA
jgi:hypothetical protein